MRKLLLVSFVVILFAACEQKNTEKTVAQKSNVDIIHLSIEGKKWPFLPKKFNRLFSDSLDSTSRYSTDTIKVIVSTDKAIKVRLEPNGWHWKVKGSLVKSDTFFSIKPSNILEFSFVQFPKGDRQYVEFEHQKQQVGVLTIKKVEKSILPKFSVVPNKNQKIEKKLKIVSKGSYVIAKSFLYNGSLKYDSLRSLEIVKDEPFLIVGKYSPYILTDKGLYEDGEVYDFICQNGFLKVKGNENLILTDSAYHKLVNLKTIDSSFVYDLRYATDSNFMKTTVYPCAECFLRERAAKAILNAQRAFQKLGYRIKFFDCFRPLHVQRKMWEVFPHAGYVANPYKGLGSMHNRGVAVDLTLIDSLGNELNMGTPFDFFGKAAHHTCVELPEEVLKNRMLLKTVLAKYGFKAIRTEWWHYSYTGYKLPKSSDANLCE